MQCGFSSSFQEFLNTSPSAISKHLKQFVPDAGGSQDRAWRDSIEFLKRDINLICTKHPNFLNEAFAILEYHVPLESRRIDALLLVRGSVVVIEFKGKTNASQADIDQAAAYARDLRAYHRACSSLKTICFLIPTSYSGAPYSVGATQVLGQSDLAMEVIRNVQADAPVPDLAGFLADDNYQPLPSLIKAARELFTSGSLHRVHRAAMATEPTLKACSRIVHHTATQNRRSLVLICGCRSHWVWAGNSHR